MMSMIPRLTLFALATLLLTGLAPTQVPTLTLTGTYIWKQSPEKPGDLKAVFTPTGENEWAVAFHFHFSGRDHVYTGTAGGSLQDGKLVGEVTNERKNRVFTFDGASANGKFSGRHAEKERNGTLEATGTLTLGPS